MGVRREANFFSLGLNFSVSIMVPTEQGCMGDEMNIHEELKTVPGLDCLLSKSQPLSTNSIINTPCSQR